jgi:hypothetical protein
MLRESYHEQKHNFKVSFLVVNAVQNEKNIVSLSYEVLWIPCLLFTRKADSHLKLILQNFLFAAVSPENKLECLFLASTLALSDIWIKSRSLPMQRCNLICTPLARSSKCFDKVVNNCHGQALCLIFLKVQRIRKKSFITTAPGSCQSTTCNSLSINKQDKMKFFSVGPKDQCC